MICGTTTNTTQDLLPNVHQKGLILHVPNLAVVLAYLMNVVTNPTGLTNEEDRNFSEG